MTNALRHAPARRFTARNEGFTCIVCHAVVPRATRGYRNHCPACLSSLHVDVFPGDRREPCAGIMDPVGVSPRHGEWLIHHRCRRCGKTRANTIAADDAWERVVLASQAPTRRHTGKP